MLQARSNINQTWWFDGFFITFSLGLLFFLFLGDRPLFVPDEGRYAEIAREMVVSGNYVTPHLDGIKYFEKPILFYWLCAAAIKFLGMTLWSVRSVNACLALLCCLLTYFTCRLLFDRRVGLLAAFILGTSSLYFVMAHMVSLDLTVTFFLTTGLYCFLLGCERPPGFSRRWLLWLAFAAAGCAVLTKGLIGIIFPMMIVGLWIAFTRQWRLLTTLYLPSSVIVFLLIVLPWHLLVMRANPEFFNFYFIEQHFMRYATMDVGHYQPAWFFLPTLLVSFFPWTCYLPQTLIRSIKNSWASRKELFLLLWAAIIFIFFSFSKSKLIPYILPVFPPIAILTALYLNDLIERPRQQKHFLFLLMFILFISVIAFVFYQFPQKHALPSPQTAALLLNLASFVLLAMLLGFFIVRAHTERWLMILISHTGLFLLLIIAALPAIDTRTILPLAKVLQPMLQPHDEVITFNQYYQDLPFYLQRTVSILNWRNELAFGMQHQAKADWLINDELFWQHWHSHKRVYLIMGMDEYRQIKIKHPEESFYLIAQTTTNVLVSNTIGLSSFSKS